MITPRYVRTLAAYNSEMNRRIYAASARLSDDARRADEGAFFGSIHRTLCHLLWADSMWMSRFDGWPQPSVPGGDSAGMITDFAALQTARFAADAGIETWASGVDDAWLAGELAWFSATAQRDCIGNRADLLVHVFNHQTHHRGQVNALLTRAGEQTGDTDLWLVVPTPG